MGNKSSNIYYLFNVIKEEVKEEDVFKNKFVQQYSKAILSNKTIQIISPFILEKKNNEVKLLTCILEEQANSILQYEFLYNTKEEFDIREYKKILESLKNKNEYLLEILDEKITIMEQM